jgi:transposase
MPFFYLHVSNGMPAAYSLDLRQKAVSAYENGEGTLAQIAGRFSIGVKTLQEWLILKKETGSVEPKEYIYRGRPPVIDEKGSMFVRKLINEKPDILIGEIRSSYKKKFKVEVAQSMISRALKKLDLRRKKKSIYAHEQEREDVKKNDRSGEKK